MRIRLFLSYGAVAAVTAVAATMLAASEPEVPAVETSVDWSSAPLEWTAFDAADAPAADAHPVSTAPTTTPPVSRI